MKEVNNLREEFYLFYDKNDIYSYLKKEYGLRGEAARIAIMKIYNGNNGFDEGYGFNQNNFFEDLEKQLNLLKKLLGENAMNEINYNGLIQDSYNELINKLAVLNRFNFLDITTNTDGYFLRNGLLKENEIYSILMEFENNGLPKELYGIFGRQIINDKNYIEWLTEKYKYGKKQKLVNLYNLKMLLKEKKLVLKK